MSTLFKTLYNLIGLKGKEETSTVEKPCHELLDQFYLTQKQKIIYIEKIMNSFEKSLRTNPINERPLALINSYVERLPDKKEEGRYIAIDLGGSYYKIYLVELQKDHVPKLEYASIRIPEEVMNTTAENFFDFMAKELKFFMEKRDILEEQFEVGVTFSFPCDIKSVKNSILLHWTKNFNISNAIGKDVSVLFENSFKNNNLKLKISAIVNDSIATLTAGRIQHSNCGIAMIVGTGFNSSYIQKVDKFNREDTKNLTSPYIILNTECGNFGRFDELSDIITKYDSKINALSPNPGHQRLEKMISGLYLGELMRIILIEMKKKGHLFESQTVEWLEKKDSFATKFVVEIASDGDETVFEVERIFHMTFDMVLSAKEMNLIKQIAVALVHRSATLVGLTIFAHVKQTEMENVSVAVDGGMFRESAYFRTVIHKTIKEILNVNTNVRIMQSLHGSGTGAVGIVAAMNLKDDPETESQHEFSSANI